MLIKVNCSPGLHQIFSDILGEMSLKEKFSHVELARLVNHIRQSVEFSKHSVPIKRTLPDAANHTVKNGCHSMPLQKFMLPSDIESLCGSVGEDVDDNFKNLVGETLDILDSDDCQNVLKMCLDAGFTHVMHNMIPFFQVEELGKLGGTNGQEPPSKGGRKSMRGGKREDGKQDTQVGGNPGK